MPRYRVLETSYIGDRIVPAGEEVEFSHDPGFNVEPLDKAAKDRATQYAKVAGERASPSDPGYISRMIMRNLEEGDAKQVGLIPASPLGSNGPNAIMPNPTSAPQEPPRPAPVDPAVLDEAAERGRADAERRASEEAARVAGEHDAAQRELQKQIAELQAKLADATKPAQDDGKAKPAGK